MVGTKALVKTRQFENQTIWNLTFKNFGFQMVGFQIPTVAQLYISYEIKSQIVKMTYLDSSLGQQSRKFSDVFHNSKIWKKKKKKSAKIKKKKSAKKKKKIFRKLKNGIIGALLSDVV